MAASHKQSAGATDLLFQVDRKMRHVTGWCFGQRVWLTSDAYFSTPSGVVHVTACLQAQRLQGLVKQQKAREKDQGSRLQLKLAGQRATAEEYCPTSGAHCLLRHCDLGDTMS